jgi:uncharacterized protein (DUF1778 family)
MKRGRPTMPATSGVRVAISVRLSPEIKDLLDGAAAKNGRTQNQEAEARIADSFRNDRIEGVLSRFIDALKSTLLRHGVYVGPQGESPEPNREQ